MIRGFSDKDRPGRRYLSLRRQAVPASSFLEMVQCDHVVPIVPGPTMIV